MTIPINPNYIDPKTRRQAISKRWRKAKMEGRLYWRANHEHWRDWDRDEVARSIEEVGGHKFYSMKAVEEFIDELGDE